MTVLSRCFTSLSVAVGLSLPVAASAQLNTLHTYQQGGGVTRAGGSEILSYTAHESTLLSTVANAGAGAFGISILSLDTAAALSERAYLDLSTTFGSMASVSSVAADPLGRGFGVATVIPTNNTSTQGKLVFFDYTAGFSGGSRILATLDVGYHPDSVSFSQDGSQIFVVNEGEFNASVANAATTGNAPGSLSTISLAGISSLNQVNNTNLTGSNVGTFDFSAGNLASGVTLQGLRNHSITAVGTSGAFIGTVPDFNSLSVYGDSHFYKGIEPEFAAQLGNKVYVTLQENNAIGVFDTTTNKWENIYKLGTITQTIDASDQDGAGGTKAVSINDTVVGLPMPDTIRAFSTNGQNYLVTVNEGDARADDRDISRFGDTGGNDSMNPILDTNLPGTATGIRANSELGRLNISRLDGDLDLDGKIDTPTMIGTRSFTIWDADTGAKVWDSGSLETLLSTLAPATHNMNSGDPTKWDERSDDKGPEPEALAVAQVGSQIFAFIGLERQNGLLMYDITDPANPTFLSYVNSNTDGLISPESLLVIAAGQNPTGKTLLIAGYEGLDDATMSGVGVYSIPEPSRAMLVFAGLGSFLFLRRRPRTATAAVA